MKSFFGAVAVLLGIFLTVGTCHALSDRETFSMELKKAQTGDAEAQFSVAKRYFAGKGVGQDYHQTGVRLP